MVSPRIVLMAAARWIPASRSEGAAVGGRQVLVHEPPHGSVIARC